MVDIDVSSRLYALNGELKCGVCEGRAMLSDVEKTLNFRSPYTEALDIHPDVAACRLTTVCCDV